MNLSAIFHKTSSHWVRYSAYEYREKDGTLFIAPAPKAKPSLYDPLKDSETMIVNALNTGMACMRQNTNEDVIRQAVMDFVSKYGLLGFMTALPTTPGFMDFDTAYLPKNNYVHEESLPSLEFANLFFPFGQLDVSKAAKSTVWNVVDRDMIALSMTMGDLPMALNMSFQREYAERYDWLRAQFKDWAFSLLASIFYYEEADETVRDLHWQAMTAFGGIAPTYHIALYDKPTLVWDFHSLLLGIQMAFSFMLTDETRPLRACRHCAKVFAASHPNAAFCGPACKNKHNVYKSRGKKE